MAGRICVALCLVCVAFVCVTEAKMKVRRGTCPDTTVMRMVCDGSRAVEGKDCRRDSQCSAGRKCCPSPCGSTECFVAREDPVLVDPVPVVDPVLVDPVPEAEVECPMLTALFCEGGVVQCDTHASCGAGRKCCPAACNGRTCYGGK